MSGSFDAGCSAAPGSHRRNRHRAATGRRGRRVLAAPCTSRFSFWMMPPKLTPSDPGGGGGAVNWYTTIPSTRNSAMRTNSRFPIGLEEFRSRVGGRRAPGHPDSNPDYSLHVFSTACGPRPRPDGRAAGVLPPGCRSRCRVDGSPPRGPRLLIVAIVVVTSDLQRSGRSAGSICWRRSARRGSARPSRPRSSASPPASCSRPVPASCCAPIFWPGASVASDRRLCDDHSRTAARPDDGPAAVRRLRVRGGPGVAVRRSRPSTPG